jgi:ribonucleoside-diphosphate reductase beta chain
MSFTEKDLQRETFLDIQLQDCYKLYKVHQQSFWIPEEIDLSSDGDSFLTLSLPEQIFIKKISTFFLISDAIVADNVDFISNRLAFREVKAFYSIQSAIENIHIEVYGNIFKTISDSKNIIEEIFSMPSVIKKREFCTKILSESSLDQIVLSNLLVEGIFFASSFSGILWLKKRGKCQGIVKANEWIARDERLHWRFACEIFKKINTLTTEEIHAKIEEVYQLEKGFINDILKEDLGDMTRSSLYEYVKFCCNEILEYIGIEPYFPDVNQPFEFMKFLNYPVKANFFETRVTNYSLPSNSIPFAYDTKKKLVYNSL